MTDLPKLNAKQRENYYYMADAMRRLEWDLHNHIEATNRIPLEWHEIAKARGPAATERVTIRLDVDVLRFFRGMGAGYQPRINQVLRSYLHARLAGVIKGADTAEPFRADVEERPLWGDTGRWLGDMPEASAAERKVELMGRLKEKQRAMQVRDGG